MHGMIGLVAGLAIAAFFDDGPSPSAARSLSPSPSPDGLAFFESKVRPLLEERCLECHRTTGKRKGGLALDWRGGWATGGDSGPAVVPGNPDESRLLEAVSYDDPTLRMPPKGKLSDAQIADLTAWVKMGAPDPRDKAPAAASAAPAASAKPFDLKERAKAHWAFQPLKPSEPPAVRDGSWPVSPIDRFVLARLEAAGLKPAPRAEKRALIRRTTFDLIGLPPSPREIDDFLGDDSPDAFRKVVDRLLASPHYGERWGRHWLDLVRYAETAGHEFDFEIPNAWRYRDYVVDAFNRDLPFNRFLVEQAAGDVMPDPRWENGANVSLIGTGFWQLGEGKHSPVDLREEQSAIIDNQIDVFGKTFLGLTLACARCHDHKFDPIAAKDYYALFGVLSSSRYAQGFADRPEPRAAAVAAIARLDDERQRQLPPLDMDLAACLPSPSADEEKWRAGSLPIADFRDGLPQGWTASGDAFAFESMTRLLPLPGAQVAIHPGGVADSGRVSPRLQGHLRSKTFVIPKPHLALKLAGGGVRVRLVIDGFQKIQAPIYGGLEFRPDSPQFRWRTMDLGMWVGHDAYLEFLDDGDGAIMIAEVRAADAPPPNIASTEPKPKPVAVPEPDQPALERWRAERTRMIDALSPPSRVLATIEGTGRNEPLRVRGNPNTFGEMVPRRFLEVFAPAVESESQAFAASGTGRLALAERLVDPKSCPLVPRVLVNRIWRHHFGEGIVRSPDDFGKMGQPPTHPELLDWLALEFIRGGWSIKATHRAMVLSSAYQMSSRADADSEATANERDPRNELLHRMPIRRLDAESIRDALLAISGRLDRKIGGPSIPPHLTPFMNGRGRPGFSGPLDGDGRRTIYLNVRRNFLTPLLLAFDYPLPATSVGRRNVSNVPAQSLALMNNPFVLQQARLWSERTKGLADLTDDQRVERLFVEAYGRPPRSDERAGALAFLQNADAKENAWAELCHALINSKEFLFIP